MVAFRATLEELKSANLLLHVIDISNPRHMEQIRSVEKILTELKIERLPQVLALNKMDLVPPTEVAKKAMRLNGTPICARNQTTLAPLLQKLFMHVNMLPQRMKG
jgi:GTP-binding protein HflX